MQRAQTPLPLRYRKPLMRTLALCAFVPLGIAGPAAAQSFSLPQPTPTPTPAPQGPVDIRDGVVIGPRTIPSPSPSPTPAPSAPAPSPSPSLAPSDTLPTVSPPSTSASPAETRPAPSTQTAPARPSETTSSVGQQATSNTEATQADESSSEPALPGFSEDSIASIPEVAPGESTITEPDVEDVETGTGWTMWAAIAALLALLGAIGCWLFARKRRQGSQARLLPAPALADAPEQQARVTEPAATTPIAAVVPAEFDLKLDITSASRSLMMFVVDYRLNIANRAASAVRDITVKLELVCARKGQASVNGVETEVVERIGPHQARSVDGQLQLQLSDVAVMRQGQTPLFIPMIRVTIGSTGQPAEVRNFVVGAPSAASATRLHPIALDQTPGGIPGLRAREIKPDDMKRTA